MKIVRKGNFYRETRNDRLVAENIGSKREGMIMVMALREAAKENRSFDPDVFELVADDYVLYRFES